MDKTGSVFGLLIEQSFWTAALATFAYIPTYAFAPAAGIRGILLIPDPLLYFLRVLFLI